MRSTCFVVLPKGILEENIEEFVASQIRKYDMNIEIEPYKKFFTKEYTLENAKKRGYENNIEAFAEYLSKNEEGIGIENGLLYFECTYNKNGRWDYYGIHEITIKGDEIKEINNTPYSVVTLDGVWHSASDFDHKPILDFKNNFETHEENIEPLKKWEDFLESLFKEYNDYEFAILDVHS